MDIAIIGYAGRFPGANSVRQFWRNLCAGAEAVSPLSDATLAAAGVPADVSRDPCYVKAEAQVADYDRFDASLFGYTAREATLADPQHRVFLETCWEALEDAGYDCDRLTTRTGVYAGAGTSLYWFEYLYPARDRWSGGFDPTEIAIGNSAWSLPTRVSHKLNLKGPSISMQTACSTSLVAVHVGAQALLAEECDLVLAGGVHLKLPVNTGYLYSVDGILSPDGHCRPFDKKAKGTIFGSGSGVVVLKRLQDALRDGDCIRAVIKGTAVNNDGGAKAGFTAPNEAAQVDVVREAQAVAGIEPGSVGFIEAHGTGTEIGDPIEVAALTQAFGEQARHTCAIGSVKGNIGHLDAAAGVAGLIKAILALEHQAIPPSINFDEANPAIDFAASPFFVNTALQPWAANGTPRRAGVSSFGLGGTNSHVVLEEAPPAIADDRPAREWKLIPLSANTPAALDRAVRQLAGYCDRDGRQIDLSDIASTCQLGRRQFSRRHYVLARTTADAVDALQAGGDRTIAAARTAVAAVLPADADVAALAAALCAEEPVFLEWATRCLAVAGRSVPADRDAWMTSALPDALRQFVFHYALLQTLAEWGIVPQLVLGRGVGALVAECLAGAMPVRRALDLCMLADDDGDAPATRSAQLDGARAFTAVVTPPSADDGSRTRTEPTTRYRALTAAHDPLDADVLVLAGQAAAIADGSRSDAMVFAVRQSTPTAADARATSQDGSVITAITRGDCDRGHIHRIVGTLWQCGAAVDWESYAQRHRGRRAPLPTYPFERTRFWVDAPAQSAAEALAGDRAPAAASARTDAAVSEESWIRSAFAELLGRSDVELSESFIELGGDSLQATQLASRIRDRFGVQIPVRSILETPTVAEIAALVRRSRADRAGETAPAALAPAAPRTLSFAQRRFWFLDALDRSNPAHNISTAVRLRGALNRTALRDSIQRLADRQQEMRAGFRTEHGEPVQYLLPAVEVVVHERDLRHLSDAEREPAMKEIARAEASTGFVLGTPPLFRSSLFVLGPDDHVLFFTIHHIIADGWSLNVAIREVAQHYRAICEHAASAAPALALQYADYVRWEHDTLTETRLAEHDQYWSRQLADLPVLDLPVDHPWPPVFTRRGGRAWVDVPAAVVTALQREATSRGATLYMALLAGFAALLHRYTGQTDLIVGSPIANRSRTEFEDLVGCFMNLLPLRLDVGGNPELHELLARVKRTCLDAYEHAAYPFELLLERAQRHRDVSRTPIFQAMFVLQNAPPADIEIAGLSIGVCDLDLDGVDYDLTLDLHETPGGVRGWLGYNAEVFDADTMRDWVRHFQTILESLAAHSERRVGYLPLAPADLSPTPAALADDAIAAAGATRFDEMVHLRAAERPDAIALCFGSELMTYERLDQRANQLAHALQRFGAGPERAVGVCLPHSIDAIVALLAILRAGAIYVPIDARQGGGRLRAIMQDADLVGLVTNESMRASLPATQVPVLSMDGLLADIDRLPTTAPAATVLPSNAAYVIYTSGSTGVPKGVVVPHQALAGLAAAGAAVFDVSVDDRVLQTIALTFDASLLNITLALANGAQLVLAPADALLPTPALLTMLKTLNITVFATFPSALALLPVEPLPALHRMIVGGEACLPPLAERWRHGRRMVNVYGPTETTVWSTAWRCDRRVDAVPIGRPVGDTQVYVLDRFMNVAPPGAVGEIYIGGSCVARGYQNMSDVTAERFVPDPFAREAGRRLYRTGDRGRVLRDGNIEFAGRVDDQVKIQGVRIEVGEVEAAMLTYPGISQAVVRPEGEGANRILVAYFATAAGEDGAASIVREFLLARLPSYMVPSRYVRLDQFPVLPSGKVDHQALSAIAASQLQAQDDQDEHDTCAQQTIAAMVCELLNLDRVGAHDNLFEIGAHSLVMTQLKARIDAEFQCECAIVDLFQQPTVAGIARLVDRKAEGADVVREGIDRAQLRSQLRARRAEAVAAKAV